MRRISKPWVAAIAVGAFGTSVLAVGVAHGSLPGPFGHDHAGHDHAGHDHDHAGHDHGAVAGPLAAVASTAATLAPSTTLVLPPAAAIDDREVVPDAGLVAVAGGTRTVVAPGGELPALDVGDEVFWDGGFVADGHVPADVLCDVPGDVPGNVLGECFTWDLAVEGAGDRLRIAIDTPSREDAFVVSLRDAEGAVLASFENGNRFNDELFVADPAPGDYVVHVRPSGATDASFRLRAKLEGDAGPGAAADGPRRALLPNLQVVPPTELGFVAPITPNGPYPPDETNPPAQVLGTPLYSCTPDESLPVALGGAGAVDCLRLTSGPTNVGAGPFDLRFTFVDDLVDGTADPYYLRGPVEQAVHHSDGSIEMRPGGTYIFHTTHTHFHDENILTYELLRVTDAESGGLAAAGSGTKSGFCPADQLFGDWYAFTQQVRGDFGEGDSPTGNCMSPVDGVLGLTSGWGDVYRWQRPGQYVEFDGNGDGIYVLRATVDKEDNVLEEDEDDNSSYALIQIVGRTIEILERGRGTDPWDTTKVVYRGSGPASVT